MEFLIPLVIVILIFSAVLHEIMHGVVADKLGDPTARLMGRLTLNPIPHLDPIGSILLPAILIIPPLLTGASPGFIFAWAKPVPVNLMHFRDPKKDMALTALAGPLTNIALAIIAAQFLKFLPLDDALQAILFIIIRLNLLLAIINLIPIPPLDGSKVLAAILPDEIARAYLSIQQFGIFVLFFLLFFPIGGFSLWSFIDTLINLSMIALGVNQSIFF